MIKKTIIIHVACGNINHRVYYYSVVPEYATRASAAPHVDYDTRTGLEVLDYTTRCGYR